MLINLENVANFKYFGTTITYQHFVHEELKNRLNSGLDYYH
jgi:hypothetical protein